MLLVLLAEDNFDTIGLYGYINLAMSAFNLALFLILITITLVRVKCNVFFRIAVVFFAYAVCFISRFINYSIIIIKNSSEIGVAYVTLDTLDSVFFAIKLFMIFFFILQVSEVRAKI